MSNQKLKSIHMRRRPEGQQEMTNEMSTNAIKPQSPTPRLGEQELKAAIMDAAIRFANEIASIIEKTREVTEKPPVRRFSVPSHDRSQGRARSVERARSKQVVRRAGPHTAGGKR